VGDRGTLVLLAVLTALGTAAASAPPAAGVGACDAIKRSRAVKDKRRHGRAPLVIGDSTLLLATPALGRLGLEADARGCRQFTSGVAMLEARRHAHALPRVAILALGANGPIGEGAIDRALRIMGRHRVLGLVTPRRSGESAAQMQRAARRHPDRVLLIDWVAFSRRHGDWFAGDGLHVGVAGAEAFARFVRRAVMPLVAPPVASLRMPRSAGGRKGCGTVSRFGRVLRVFVTRGDPRITCARARDLARRPPLRRIAGWARYDWSRTGDGPWTDVYVREDGRVVVGAIARR
jgi:hypothetical protein